MASQPANTTISVLINVRAQRDAHRYDSVKNLTGNLRKLVAVVPGDEITTQVLARNTAVTDFSSVMGEAAANAVRGLPVSIGVKEYKDFGVVQRISGNDFPFAIGNDKFVSKTIANKTDDLFAQAKAAS